MSSPSAAAPDSAPDSTSARTEVRVRRAPKIPAFMVVGGLIGLLVTLVITPLFPADPQVGLPALVGYFSLYGITAGVVLGALVGIALDRRSQKRARLVEAEHEAVDALPIDGVIDDDLDPAPGSTTR
ncbi:MAG: hypothetical protein KIT89_09450 [Microcella sp.]|uniref:hypothetical protein n=1 Tax=Microcella sp. TaxID=1913979 RepID=UPI0024C508D1|nr:hypothetical protein [Microcella sp.]UYN82931.1 MAG: hypothetical protein KIT89_09450 [Microcella sp.]